MPGQAISAQELIDRARALARERPDQTGFATAFETLVARIALDFDGEVAEHLFGEARDALDRQCEITERIRDSRTELRRLAEAEQRLAELLARIAPLRPPGETLH